MRAHRRRVGPRQPGAIYQDARGHVYRVDAVHFGQAARSALGRPMSWAITVTDADGRQRTHCTPWDPRRNRIRYDLCSACLTPCHHHDGTPPATPSNTPDKALLDSELATVAAEIVRTDGKASLLLAFVGAGLAGLAQVTGHGRTLALTCAALTALDLAAAVVVLLLTVWPRLGSGGIDRAFPHWARLSPAEVRAALTTDDRAARIVTLSRIALRKYRHLRVAVLLCIVAVPLAALAVALR
ncbi:Pycsar system effector family protein [Streptantibioticus parmotrematis]|uniref:Pycsar system effector family protein n=1 Tax=Streptantibioticus parmotrematis TaxID=2873249 RepID=UPI0033D03BD2